MARKEILYWTATEPPHKFVRDDVPDRSRRQLALVLKNGERVHAWMGWAECRICGAELGTQCLGALGFQWPQKAEHYILEHGVWTPGCAELLDAASELITGLTEKP